MSLAFFERGKIMFFKVLRTILVVLILAGVAGILAGICWLCSKVSAGMSFGVEKITNVMTKLISKTKIGGSKNEQ